MPKLRNDSREDSNPGLLDCESGILLLSYSAQSMALEKYGTVCVSI